MRRAVSCWLALWAVVCLLCGCVKPPAPCVPQAQIEADYLEQLLAQCKGYTVASCPAVPALKAERMRREKESRCRY